MRDFGKQTIKMEREFNRRARFTAKDNRVPAWMEQEPLPPHKTVFNVPEDELDHIFDEID